MVLLYSKYNSEKINKVSQSYFIKEIYKSLNEVTLNLMLEKDIEDILKIYKNNENEILYVDYNLNKSYEILSQITKELRNSLNVDNTMKSKFVYDVPFFIGSNSVFLVNIGPKITINISYINYVLTNIHTKITNYGLNNALVEAYVKITIEGRIITPVEETQKSVEYDLLIASKVINGRVPKYYGNYLTSDSSIFDVPIK